MRLIDGGITNIENNNTYNVKFKMTDYDLSKFSTKTVTVRKIQETDTSILINCLKKIMYFNLTFNMMNSVMKHQLNKLHKKCLKGLVCHFIFWLYIIATSIILKPKNIIWSRFYKTYLFVLGVIIIIFSQIIINLYGKSFSLDIYLSTLPF